MQSDPEDSRPLVLPRATASDEAMEEGLREGHPIRLGASGTKQKKFLCYMMFPIFAIALISLAYLLIAIFLRRALPLPGPSHIRRGERAAEVAGDAIATTKKNLNEVLAQKFLNLTPMGANPK